MAEQLSSSLLLAVPLAPLAGSAIAGLLGTKFLGNVVGRKVSHTVTILGVAIALVRQKLRLEVVERARKRSGVDYWLGSGKQLFQKSARLEVSGILRGDATQVRSRVKEKHSQTKQSDQTRLPAIVVVVEFGAPMIAFEERLGR